MIEIGNQKLLVGCDQAAEYLSVPSRRLQRLVENRRLRVIRPNKRSVMFFPAHLAEDFAALEQEKL
jgi:excisionase family DNA binding protein